MFNIKIPPFRHWNGLFDFIFKSLVINLHTKFEILTSFYQQTTTRKFSSRKWEGSLPSGWRGKSGNVALFPSGRSVECVNASMTPETLPLRCLQTGNYFSTVFFLFFVCIWLRTMFTSSLNASVYLSILTNIHSLESITASIILNNAFIYLSLYKCIILN